MYPPKWTVVWRRPLRVPWTTRRSNQSILKQISPEYSLEGLMLKLKLQYFGHLIQELTHWKRPWYWERLKAGGEGDDRGWDGWMASPTWWTWGWASSRSWWWTEKPGMVQSMGLQRVGYNWVTELNWTEMQPTHAHHVYKYVHMYIDVLFIRVICFYYFFHTWNQRQTKQNS